MGQRIPPFEEVACDPSIIECSYGQRAKVLLDASNVLNVIGASARL